MRHNKAGSKLALAGATLLLAGSFFTASAQANTATMQHHPSAPQAHTVTNWHGVVHMSHSAGRTHGYSRFARSYGGMSCVPFARAESGILLSGNAYQWWDNAAGRYARGATPEPGSVLTFRANGRMTLGHVAVVARVVNPREVLIDQANWPGATMRGGVSAAIPVVDVSEANDWTAVRVGLGNGGEFGSVFPTYGFIYDRPDTGTVVANANPTTAPAPAMNPPPHDLRQAVATPHRPTRHYVEVAEVPRHPRPHRVVGLIPPPPAPAGQ